MRKLQGTSVWLRHLLLLPLLWLTAVAAQADSKVIGNYTVHHIAVNSTFINADIAEQYDIVRGKRSAFLNVSVLRNNTDGSTTPVVATLSGSKQNLMQQNNTIEFKEVREGAAIYYIGQFDFSNAEFLRFVVDVQPEHQGTTHKLEWSTTLYSD